MRKPISFLYFDFSIPNCNKTCNDTFLYHGINDWNSLLDDVKCIKNPTLYKSAVKNFLVANWTTISERVSLLLRSVYITL